MGFLRSSSWGGNRGKDTYLAGGNTRSMECTATTFQSTRYGNPWRNRHRCLVSAFPLLFVHCTGHTYHEGLRACRPTVEQDCSCLGQLSRKYGAAGDPRPAIAVCSTTARRGDFLLLVPIWTRIRPSSTGHTTIPPDTAARSHFNARFTSPAATEVISSRKFRYRSRYDSRMRRNEVRIESWWIRR